MNSQAFSLRSLSLFEQSGSMDFNQHGDLSNKLRSIRSS